MSEIKLLPCPFCGGEEIEETYYSFMPVLKCKICGAIMTFPASFRGNYRTELARKWNTRKPMQEIVKRLEEEKEKSLDRFVGGRCNGKTLQMGINYGIEKTIRIVKEAGGMNENHI